MALHRDVYWVGRQWAVTGYGMQAVDQKQKSKFDIEASRLWDEGLLEGLCGQRWFNAGDFTEALAIARARYPAPPRKAKATPAPEPPKMAARQLNMRIEGWSAKFAPMWRVRIKR